MYLYRRILVYNWLTVHPFAFGMQVGKSQFEKREKTKEISSLHIVLFVCEVHQQYVGID